MTFHDVELSRSVTNRSQISEFGSTAVIELADGSEQRVQRWSATRIRMNLAYALRTTSELRDILAFKRARGHRAHTFRVWNPLDYSTNAANTPSDTDVAHVDDEDELLGVGDGTTTDFQLIKTYTSGTETATRTITKPIDLTVKVAVDTVAKVENTDFTVNYSTGVVTFLGGSVPLAGQDVTAGCQFNEEMRFESDDVAVSIESFNRGEPVGGLSLVSVLSSDEVVEDFPYRGSSTPTFSADLQLTPQHGALVVLAPASSGLDLILPDSAGYPEGGPHWLLTNSSGSNSFDVVSDGVTLATLAAGDWAEVWLDSTGWMVFA